MVSNNLSDNISIITLVLTPLTVNSTQGHTPEVWAEASQLGNVVSHLHGRGCKLRQSFIFSKQIASSCACGDVVGSYSPALQKGSWRCHRGRQCGRRRTESPGRQTSCGRPALAARCCFGHTWRGRGIKGCVSNTNCCFLVWLQHHGAIKQLR